MSLREAYRTLNMGAGFAIFCRPGVGDEVVSIVSDAGLGASVMGVVEAGPREVLIDPVGLRYEQRELQFAA
jgi:phosphoribosylformylglycinamidine cyclo-ligase